MSILCIFTEVLSRRVWIWSSCAGRMRRRERRSCRWQWRKSCTVSTANSMRFLSRSNPMWSSMTSLLPCLSEARKDALSKSALRTPLSIWKTGRKRLRCLIRTVPQTNWWSVWKAISGYDRNLAILNVSITRTFKARILWRVA